MPSISPSSLRSRPDPLVVVRACVSTREVAFAVLTMVLAPIRIGVLRGPLRRGRRRRRWIIVKERGLDLIGVIRLESSESARLILTPIASTALASSRGNRLGRQWNAFHRVAVVSAVLEPHESLFLERSMDEGGDAVQLGHINDPPGTIGVAP